MSSKRKQVNVRIDEETREVLPALCAAMREAMGVQIGNSDLFRLGVRALRKKYLAGRESTPPVPKKIQPR